MRIEDIMERRESNMGLRLLSHMLFWLLSFCSTYILVKYSFSIYRDSPFSFLTPLINVLSLILMFYPLMYFAFPRFLKKRNWIVLIGSIFFLVFLYVLFQAIGEMLVFKYCTSCLALAMENNPNYVSVIQKSVVDNVLFKASNIQLFLQLFSGLILPIAIKSSLGYYQFYSKNMVLEKEKVRLELNFLKAQVNPHFLFNTLNNLYGLVMHERTESSLKTIGRLTEFLRYTLDNADKKSIRLSDEVKLIENYVELEKLRLNHTEVDLDIEVDDSNLKLPPLLFIPLLENAFKYNVDQKESRIEIQLNVNKGCVELLVQNVFDRNARPLSKGGLGLKNLEKRLKLYFQDKYTYKVIKEGSIYRAYLNLDLS